MNQNRLSAAVEASLLAAAAPAMTDAHIDSVIAAKDFHRIGETLTICVLTLVNGFTVTGQNACSTAKKYDRELGEQYSYKDARAQIWPLEGYLAKQREFESGQGATAIVSPTAEVLQQDNHTEASPTVGVLVGSDAFPTSLTTLDGYASYTLDGVVRYAFGKFVGTYEDWNGLSTGERDDRIRMAAEEMTGSLWALHDGRYVQLAAASAGQEQAVDLAGGNDDSTLIDVVKIHDKPPLDELSAHSQDAYGYAATGLGTTQATEGGQVATGPEPGPGEATEPVGVNGDAADPANTEQTMGFPPQAVHDDLQAAAQAEQAAADQVEPSGQAPSSGPEPTAVDAVVDSAEASDGYERARVMGLVETSDGRRYVFGSDVLPQTLITSTGLRVDTGDAITKAFAGVGTVEAWKAIPDLERVALITAAAEALGSERAEDKATEANAFSAG